MKKAVQALSQVREKASALVAAAEQEFLDNSGLGNKGKDEMKLKRSKVLTSVTVVYDTKPPSLKPETAQEFVVRSGLRDKGKNEGSR